MEEKKCYTCLYYRPYYSKDDVGGRFNRFHFGHCTKRQMQKPLQQESCCEKYEQLHKSYKNERAEFLINDKIALIFKLLKNLNEYLNN